MMEFNLSVGGGVGAASLLAGPVFVTSCALASLYLELPRPIVVSANQLGLFLILLIPAVAVGFLIAFVPVAIGAALLFRLGRQFEVLRAPIAWTLVGAAIGIALVAALELDGAWREIGFGLVATCAICATICRRRIVWDADGRAGL